MSVLAVVVALLGFGSELPAWFGGALGVVVVLAAIQQIAYLLRVVYPSPARSAASSHTESQGLHDVE